MATTTLDLQNILQENTLVFKNVPDINGNTLDENGSPRTWTIRPFTVERERRIAIARLENSDYLQNIIAQSKRRWDAADSGEPLPPADEQEPMVTAEQWAPIVAAMVCEPDLDIDDLIENFSGMILRHVGETAEAFFQEGPSKMKEGRALRRAK
jgi:hypothetical protein